MRQSSLGSCLLLLGASTWAAPTPDPDPPAPDDAGISFKIGREGTGGYISLTANMANYQTFMKHGWDIPESLSLAFSVDQNKIAQAGPAGPPAQEVSQVTGPGNIIGNVESHPDQYNTEYLTPVTIGGNLLNLDLDTGSSELWVFNTEMSGDHGSHSLYDPSSSSSFQSQPDLSMNAKYGDKTDLTGSVGSDTVKIDSVTVQKQSIGLPRSLDSSVVSDSSDGILGLGFSSMNKVKNAQTGAAAPQRTWMENAMSLLAQPLFAVNFKYGKAGYFNFGAIDSTAYSGESLQYVALDNSTGYWGFASPSFAVGSGGSQTNSGANLAVPDTGASVFYVDPQVYDAYWSQVSGAVEDQTQGKVFPCSTTLPDFHVAIGDNWAAVPGWLLNWTTADGYSDKCVGGVQSNGGQAPQVYGEILFKAYYFVFDYGGSRIGFASHA